MTRSRTIFDVGLHKGEDAEFYLRKGFRVVGIDANADMCAAASERLAEFIASGDLVILNLAIAERPGQIPFYKNADSTWGTASPRWAERNERFGFPTTEETLVEAVPLAAIVEEYGEPYYIKIDIEGLDLVALKSLAQCSSRPKYISIESDKTSLAALREEFRVFQQLGYDRFKVVPQHEVPRQKPPSIPAEGNYVDHVFKWGSSGLFGEEAPGSWISADEAIETYKRAFLKYQLWGDDPLIRSRGLQALLRRLFGQAGWHDTHARLSGAG